MDRSATTSSPVAPRAATSPVDEHDVDRYAGLLRDLREALLDPPEFAFRAGEPTRSRMAA
jgi:hypothetical protein